MVKVEYKVVVGLEIHVQLNTCTKMFCGCELEFAAEPNSRVCPVCLGMPGVLPVMNKQAIEYSVLAGLALNCEVAKFTKWDRKSYYYPDLPKNYQISQYDLPLAERGFMEIPLGNNKTKKVRIIRAHLEEDAGKNLHATGDFSQVDLNRTGTPLLEIVTEPDISSGAEAKALAVELQRIVRYLGVSQADMQKGHMRFEPNVNLVISENGSEYKTPIAEIKNLNSFRALERSIDYEVVRQFDEFGRMRETMALGNKSTRGWDDEKQVTVLQREKEESSDYRYFPDPDLVPVEISEEWFSKIKAMLCELPAKRQLRYVTEYGLSEYDAGVLTGDRSTADYFEKAVKCGVDPKRVCNIITQDLMKKANEKGCTVPELNIPPDHVAKLCQMVTLGDISSTAASTIIELRFERPDADPWGLAKEFNLMQKSDAGELERVVDEVLAENSKAVADAIGGKKAKASRGFLLGQVMKKTKGRANPKIVNEILNRKLDGMP